MGPNLPGANCALFNLGGGFPTWRKTPKLEDDPASASFSGGQTRGFYIVLGRGVLQEKNPEKITAVGYVDVRLGVSTAWFFHHLKASSARTVWEAGAVSKLFLFESST